MNSRGIVGGLYMTRDELNKILEQTLNQHGVDAVVNVVMDMLINEYNNGYEDGYNTCMGGDDFIC